MGKLRMINCELDVNLHDYNVTFISFGASAAQKQAHLLPHSHTKGNNIPFEFWSICEKLIA